MVIFYDETESMYLIGHWVSIGSGWTRFNEVMRFDNYTEARYELRYLNGGNI